MLSKAFTDWVSTLDPNPSTPETRLRARVEARAVGVAQRDFKSHVSAVAVHVGAYVRQHRATPYIAVALAVLTWGTAEGTIEALL
jgi:hypothetical protein